MTIVKSAGISAGELRSALAQDDALRAKANRIVGLVIDEVERTMRYGDPPTKAALMKSTIPSLLAALKPEESDGTGELLKEMRELRAEFLGLVAPEVL